MCQLLHRKNYLKVLKQQNTENAYSHVYHVTRLLEVWCTYFVSLLRVTASEKWKESRELRPQGLLFIYPCIPRLSHY